MQLRLISFHLSRNAAQIMIGFVAQPCRGMSIANFLKLRDDLLKDVSSSRAFLRSRSVAVRPTGP